MRSSFWFQERSASQLGLPLEVVCGGPQLVEVANFSSLFAKTQEITILSPTWGPHVVFDLVLCRMHPSSIQQHSEEAPSRTWSPLSNSLPPHGLHPTLVL